MLKLYTVIPIFIAILIFYIFLGFKIIDPTFINWTMEGDAGQHFLGWHFFRYANWQLPLGTINNYLYPNGTNTIFMDIIPIIAIILKPFSFLLPDKFQYTGIWLLSSVVLQGFFAALLLEKVIKNKLFIIMGSIFFILSPILYFRMGGHDSLTTHWLILAALYLYLSPCDKKNDLKYLALILFASLVHFYLLAMVLSVWIAYLFKIPNIKKNKKIIAKKFIFITSILFLNMLLFGYFSIGLNGAGGGYGLYSMNILAPINSLGFSAFFNSLSYLSAEQAGEGFNYLGLGVIILIVISIVILYKKYSVSMFLPYKSLIIISILLTLFAISHKVGFGSYLLLNLEDLKIFKLGSVLRASGRMFWPVYYILIFISIILIVKNLKPKISFMILSITLIIQVMDLYPFLNGKKDLENRVWNYSLKSPQWDILSKSIKHIVVVPPSVNANHDYSLGIYAADNKLTLNVGYAARVDIKEREEYIGKIMQSFTEEKFKKDTLYIISSEYLPSLEILNKDFNQGILDNYRIVYNKNIPIKIKPFNKIIQ